MYHYHDSTGKGGKGVVQIMQRKGYNNQSDIGVSYVSYRAVVQVRQGTACHCHICAGATGKGVS